MMHGQKNIKPYYHFGAQNLPLTGVELNYSWYQHSYPRVMTMIMVDDNENIIIIM